MALNNLKTVNNYAREKSVSTTTIYNWIKEGKVKVVIIDGVKFIFEL
jgi:predicted site-specific integrase-resolvase